MADGFSRGLNAVAIALTVSLVVIMRQSCAMGKVTSPTADQPPHIVIILADDLGWNDVSFHGSDQIPTPNIDALAYNGIILNQHYVPALCTPSRSALMTGKYPIHTGMQHLVILEAEPWGLPLQETILPEYLKQAGYSTHAIGKWHLGFFRKEYTPLYRGFDTHFGYYQGFQDYFDHSVKATFAPYDGYDMRRNSSVDWAARGRYSTDLFTQEAVNVIERHDSSTPMFLYIAHLAPHTGNMREPFQAPDADIAKFSHIDDPERRVYAAMVSKLDESVGEVVAALRAKGMLDNSIIVFMADNGAPTHGIHSNRGSNYPLRGIKETPWEGGTRGAAAIWSPHLKHTQRVSHQMMYMTDWLPTLYSAAGMDVRDLGNIDGVDMWKSLVENEESPRKEFLYNIDDIGDVYAALRKADWKYVTGGVHKGAADGWYGETGREEFEVEYDVNSVLRSRAGVSLAGFVTKQQIKEKVQRKAAENHVNKPKLTENKWKLLVEDTVRALRRQAEVRCTSLNETNSTTLFDCHPHDSPCLFNIRTDPCETMNLAQLNPEIISDMEQTILRYRKTAVKPNNVPSEPEADPALWNGTWISWRDEMETVILEDADNHQLIRNTIMAGAILLGIVAIIALILRLSVPPTSDRLKSPTDMTSVVSIFKIANHEQSGNGNKKTQMSR